jgi:hypothetical protein
MVSAQRMEKLSLEGSYAAYGCYPKMKRDVLTRNLSPPKRNKSSEQPEVHSKELISLSAAQATLSIKAQKNIKQAA